jgi:hypothetical protein
LRSHTTAGDVLEIKPLDEASAACQPSCVRIQS